MCKYDINEFFNSRGTKYRQLNLKEKIQSLTLDEKIFLLKNNGMLVKRPILITDSNVLIGFKIDEWNKALK